MKSKVICTVIKIVICVMCILVIGCVCGATLLLDSDYIYAKKLVKAIRAEDIGEVERILDKNPECVNTYPYKSSLVWLSAMNETGFYPLTEACRTGNGELVKLLVERGADVNCEDWRMPLAVIYRQKDEDWYEISCYLIENGASLNYPINDTDERVEVLEDIVQNKPGGNAEDYVPESAEEVERAFYYALNNCDQSRINWMRVLQQSVTNNKISIVRFLLDEGYCDINDNSVGMTALMFAARDSDVAMVQLLLDYGADKNIVSDDGKTAYDYAAEYDEKEIMDLLKE